MSDFWIGLCCFCKGYHEAYGNKCYMRFFNNSTRHITHPVLITVTCYDYSSFVIYTCLCIVFQKMFDSIEKYFSYFAVSPKQLREI